jgi:cell division protein FtsW (lipid II flippase)
MESQCSINVYFQPLAYVNIITIFLILREKLGTSLLVCVRTTFVFRLGTFIWKFELLIGFVLMFIYHTL